MKQKIKAEFSSYIDDLYVDEEIVDAETVGEHLKKWGLVCKDPQRIGESQCVEQRQADWFGSKRDNESSTSSQCGVKLARTFPGCWMAAGVDWGAEVSDTTMKMLREAAQQLRTQDDPAKGN